MCAKLQQQQVEMEVRRWACPGPYLPPDPGSEPAPQGPLLPHPLGPLPLPHFRLSNHSPLASASAGALPRAL